MTKNDVLRACREWLTNSDNVTHVPQGLLAQIDDALELDNGGPGWVGLDAEMVG